MKLLSFAAISFIMIALASGCVTRGNYKVLSFFFDGVPDPEMTVDAVEGGERKDEQKKAANPNASI
ncbi:MAG: hypothetical protein WAV13_14805, partial [Thermodesulfovibrionales bacterium]